ncbi:MAG: putative 4-hydroxybenzoate polyprenyltransferase [Prevotellaceae bacterium]|jgi:4-hydroxybenzoate polyprenyltransferase|nr:putative 4-hydroxybenzoate polyprenyltransferase [Prevotellaceae bacterium]
MGKLKTVQHFFSLVKFSHTVFAMPFALTGFVWAWHESDTGEFPWKVLLLVLLCMVFARNAAMAFNRYIDREYDRKNRRTKNREIPAGIITPAAALVFVVVNCILFCLTTVFINRLAFYLSFPALAVILGYSYTKRFTSLCHFILGAGLAIAPTGAYIALAGEFALIPVLLSLTVLFWVGGFDILYALPDCGFDRENSLHSVPVAAGPENALILSAVAHVVSILIALLTGVLSNRGLFYWTGCAIFAGILIYQHAAVSVSNLKRINAAFGLMNGMASVCYAIFSITDILVYHSQ